MSSQRVTWLGGDASLQFRIERALAADPSQTTLLHQSKHRSVHRLDVPGDPAVDRSVDLPVDSGTSSAFVSLVIKIHQRGTGRRRLREALKRLARQSPGRREWRALSQLGQAGVPVPTARGWGRLANGDEFVVCDFLSTDPVGFLPADPSADPREGLAGASGVARGRRTDEANREARQLELANAIAKAIDTLHRAGFRHGDLHLGNLLLVGGVIHLLDVQHARPTRGPNDRLWDLASLELSLARAGWTVRSRMALRQRLGVGPDFDPVLRRFLRDHLRGRSRRVLRLGRKWSRVRIGRVRGLRDACLDAHELAAIFAAAESADVSEPSESKEASRSAAHEVASPSRRQGRVRLLKVESGNRRVLVKRFEAGGLRRAFAILLRGGPAVRAFRRGQKHALFSNRAARSLAYLEQSRRGLPIRSWLVMECVGQTDLDAYQPDSPEDAREVASRLGEWLADLHAWGVGHRDLKGSNLRIELQDDAIRFWLIDLEDLSKGPVDLSQSERLHALSQLNASLTDDAFDLDSRRVALERYHARLPFVTKASDRSDPSRLNEIATEIGRRSLARHHRWRARDCDCLGTPGEAAKNDRPAVDPIRRDSP